MIELLKKNKELWDLYTRKEEYNPVQLDKYQRFLSSYSTYTDVLEPKTSKYLVENGFKFSWPDDYKFALCLTHDVDNVYPSWKYRCFTSMKLFLKFNFKKSKDRFFKKENPYLSFRDIINLEKRYDATSSFYFIVSDRDIHGITYDLSDFENEMGHIVDNGCEVGLHGGYYSYDNLDAIKQEKKKLEKTLGRKVIGYRNHFLRLKIPETWTLLEKAGFRYDTTLGYADTVGFRNGMCHPFQPFNLHANKEIDILEIPLVIMDGALFRHMHLDLDESWHVCKKIIDTVRNVRGVVTIVWHNDSFDDVYFKGWGKLYEKILKYSSENKGWLTSGKEIYNCWSKQMK